jgi:hypothetical protein
LSSTIRSHRSRKSVKYGLRLTCFTDTAETAAYADGVEGQMLALDLVQDGGLHELLSGDLHVDHRHLAPSLLRPTTAAVAPTVYGSGHRFRRSTHAHAATTRPPSADTNKGSHDHPRYSDHPPIASPVGRGQPFPEKNCGLGNNCPTLPESVHLRRPRSGGPARATRVVR